MPLRSTLSLAILCLAMQTFPAAAQAPTVESKHPIPTITEKNNHHALLVDGHPYLMLGFQANNSSAWPAYFDKVFPAAALLHANTVELPVYWEQLEPTPNHYDFSLVDDLLTEARQHQVHLVLLWFGTWKNGSSHYNPQWMKLDQQKYPFVLSKDGKAVDSPSVYSPSRLAADKAAFAALMRHLRTADPQRTVLMVQVQNEAGIWHALRDYRPEAEKQFAAPVPEKLVKALNLKPSGTWSELFPDNPEGAFSAWQIATYIEQVAAAGKAEYPLPLYVNAALRDPFNARPGSYESGAPTDDNLRIYQVAAPSISLIAPDIYMPQYDKVLKTLSLYSQFNNPLLIPEAGNEPIYAHYVFAALGHGAIGFAPFGLDLTAYSNLTEGPEAFGDAPAGAKAHPGEKSPAEQRLAPFANEYALLAPIAAQIAQANLDGTLQGASEDPASHTQTLDYRRWQAELSYGLPAFGNWIKPKGNNPPDGGAIIIQLGEDEFLVAGHHVRVDFKPAFDASKKRYWLEVAEGSYDQNGNWKTDRLWNGDQTDYGLNLSAEGTTLLKVKLTTF